MTTRILSGMSFLYWDIFKILILFIQQILANVDVFIVYVLTTHLSHITKLDYYDIVSIFSSSIITTISRVTQQA